MPWQVRYGLLGEMFRDRSLWRQLLLSVALNWLIGPLVMTGLAWACLPDEPMARYRNGVILVGLARCIAMVRNCYSASLVSHTLRLSRPQTRCIAMVRDCYSARMGSLHTYCSGLV